MDTIFKLADPTAFVKSDQSFFFSTLAAHPLSQTAIKVLRNSLPTGEYHTHCDFYVRAELSCRYTSNLSAIYAKHPVEVVKTVSATKTHLIF